MSMLNDSYDVIVVGAGNAGLCAALSAREAGAEVLLLEKAPKEFRGGNTRFSGGGFRFTYASLDDIRPMVPELTDEEAAALDAGSYTAADFFDDIMHVTEYCADEPLSRLLVDESYATVRWLTDLGVKWILSTGTHAVRVKGKVKFPAGRVISVNDAGAGLVATLFPAAERAGVVIAYEAKAVELLSDEQGRVSGVTVRTRDGQQAVKASGVVLAAGGFEANPEMRVKYLGPGWDLVKVRGCRYNTGETLEMALREGAQPTGHWSGCHAVMVDAEAPAVEAAYQHRYSYPYGILVDIDGKRFVDEGEDNFSYTYAKFGRAILGCPNRVAYQIFDQKVLEHLRPEYNKGSRVVADTIESLGKRLVGLDWENLVRTVTEYNAAVGDAPFDPSKKDGKSATGIVPQKSNWAQRLDTPPFYGFPVACGITFTFGGISIDLNGAVQNTEGATIPGLFAAGEITGGSFYHAYPGGSGLMKGAAFGRIAGRNAAKKR